MNDTVHFEKTLSSETLFEGRVITLTKDTAPEVKCVSPPSLFYIRFSKLGKIASPV